MDNSRKPPKIAGRPQKLDTPRTADGSSLKRTLVSLRKAAGLTQLQIAERLGTSRTHISRLESENSDVSPAVSTVQAYAKAVGYELEVNFVRR